jgi:transcriptional regulator with XRE-family HTH domain
MTHRDRLFKIMESQGMNAKQFALELGVSAGTLSNIFGGRNKPSLELLQNTLQCFPELSTEWLILGKGDMYLPGVTPTIKGERNLFTEIDTTTQPVEDDVAAKLAAGIKQVLQIPEKAPQTPAPRQVQKIVIFYTDGTFEER